MTKVSPQFDIRDVYISKTNFNQNELVLLFYFFGKRSADNVRIPLWLRLGSK